MAPLPEAFALLVLSNVSITQGGVTETGVLSLECVTIAHPGSVTSEERDVYLVLRLNTTETPLDPERVVQRIDGPKTRIYNFHGTLSDTGELTLTFHLPVPDASSTAYFEDLETFQGILAQYHADLRGAPHSPVSPPVTSTTRALGSVPIDGPAKGEKDLRGHLVMIDENTGEIVGEVEDRFRIQEDPLMRERGHENDPVVIEVSDETPAESDANALKAFARIVPPDQQNWITQGATVVSHAISMTTNLVLTTITAASNYYINHSTPSPQHSGANSPVGTPNRDGNSTSSPPPLPRRPSRALVFLTSESTRKGLSTVHAVSGEAVKISSKTIGFIDGLIRRAMGAKPKQARTAALRAGLAQPTPVPPSASTPPLASSRSPSLVPLAYAAASGRPPLPPRSTSPAAPPLPPRDNVRPLTTTDRVIISADLILSTIDHSARQLLDVSTNQFGKVMTHKYGAEAGESSTLIANTARNVGLVYVDMSGIGRRALLKRAGRTFVKARFSSGTSRPNLYAEMAAGKTHTASPPPLK